MAWRAGSKCVVFFLPGVVLGLNNIRKTGEFVVNIPPVRMVEAVMICSKNFPPEVDEFKQAGLEARPSCRVKAPGVAGCLAWAECTLVEEISRKSYSLVIGKVVNLEANDAFAMKRGKWTMSGRLRCP